MAHWPIDRAGARCARNRHLGWIAAPQHLGYLEFDELVQVAQRAFEQRQIVINDVAIRPATEELKVCREYDRIRGVLVNAFSISDFDAFDLNLKLLLAEIVLEDVSGLRRRARASSRFIGASPRAQNRGRGCSMVTRSRVAGRYQSPTRHDRDSSSLRAW